MRRGKMEIWADIIKAVADEAARSAGDARVTRVRSAANVPYDRFQQHVGALAECGLLVAEPLEVTPEGQEFLRMAQVMRETALDPSTHPPHGVDDPAPPEGTPIDL